MTPDTETRDYRDTLFLPNTEFPMRAGLPRREPDWIARWDEMRLYQRLREDAKARGAPQWILHDGPPYANGPIHLGTAMQKALKDMAVRSRQMTGHDASYLPGWDCHGLPIEWKVEEAFRAKGRAKDDVPPGEFRAACRAYAAEWVEVQKAQFRRVGIEGEWDDPYLTMKPESEAAIVREFLTVAMSGRLVRGAKPVMWSPVERTALAEAEVEYHDRKVPVIWVKFPVKVGAGTIPVGEPGQEPAMTGASVVIWTTTPWTIPANQAVAFNSNLSYGQYRVDAVMSEKELGFAPYASVGERLLMADALAKDVFANAKVTSWTRLGDCSLMPGAIASHPLAGLAEFFDHNVPLLAGDHVTDEAGTGFVHTAPAHGEDDFNVWVESGRTTAEIRQVVDADGCYTDEVPAPFAGLDIIRTSGKKRGEPGKANDAVIKALAESGNLLARGMTTIRDAHSWRSRAPVIRRATPQWFIAMDVAPDGGRPLREIVMDALEDVDFFPKSGRNRLTSMVEGRPDWLVSRQRNWGVPITVFVNTRGEPHTAALSRTKAERINKRILKAIAQGGVEAWFDTPGADFLKSDADPADWEKVTDVLDVWFDSGTTHAFALRDRGIIDDATGRADLYLEGSDQHRGWFQSSLLECCATRGMAPYRQILTHGFIVDQDGRKMSKALGNTIEPQEIADKYGLEILRLWAASSDFTEDLRISDEILKGAVETYRRLRNTLRYLLGALDGYAMQAEHVQPDEMPELERWVLHRLAELDGLVREAYDTYDFRRVMSALTNFCAVDLSAIYFDIRKDSLYCDPPAWTADHWDEATAVHGNRRRAARTVMHAVLERLLCWLAPIAPFTTEEAFLESPLKDRADSVHLLQFPDTPAAWRDEALAAKWAQVLKVRRVVTGALEVERREKRIGASLEAAPVVHLTDPDVLARLDGVDMAEVCITSGIMLTGGDLPGGAFALEEVPGVAVVPAKAAGVKCARSWKYFDPDMADPDYRDITPRDALAVRAIEAAG